jgi:hypothetical protein
MEFDDAPRVLNLLPPTMPTRGELVSRLKAANPDLRAIRLPRWVLAPLSLAALAAQKVLRPGSPAIHLSKIFAVQRYENALAQEVFGAAKGSGIRS